MKINKNEDAFREKIKENIELPYIVKSQVEGAYDKIKNGQVIQERRKINIKYWIKKGVKTAGGIAAVLAIAFLFYIVNPVMAEELPVIGTLFEKIQDKLSVYGSFADKFTSLIESKNLAFENKKYSKKEDGLEITVSEVYANDQAIYLTMSMKSDEPFPETRVREVVGNGDARPVIRLQGDSSLSFRGDYKECTLLCEGVFLDSNTYACLLRIDLLGFILDRTEYNYQKDLLDQQIKAELDITDEDMDRNTEEGAANLERFIHEVSVRKGSLEQYIKTKPLPEKFDLNLNITHVFGEKISQPVWDANSDLNEEHREYSNQYLYNGEWIFDIPITIDDSRTSIHPFT